jgi:hypothetical protein
MVVIRLIEAIDLPACCAECGDFMDDLCVEFPAVYDINLAGYLCEVCAQTKSPAISAMLFHIMAGALFAYYAVNESPKAGAQGDYVKDCCMRMHEQHFAEVYGKPEPDYYLTTQAEQ